MIWFGIIVVLVTEIRLITPPIGMNAFVVKSVLPQVALADIFKGVIPYIFALLLGLLVVFYFPVVATLLSGIMR